MSYVAEELIFVLIFAVVWLVQWLLKRRRQRTAARQNEDVNGMLQPERQPHPMRDATHVRRTLPGPVAPHPNSPPAHGAHRRFSRRALMADRRALQDAIVVATLLGPCRAQRPHDSD